ncbi:hypothetical protein Tco_1230532 [Tanacetum coccineum]
MEVILDEKEVAIDVVPLATKSPSIVDWKIHKEGKKSYYQIVRADGKSQMYRVFSQMLKSFTREDLEDLYKLVKAKYGSTRPVEDLDLVLWNDLKTMFEPHVEDEIWKLQQRKEISPYTTYNYKYAEHGDLGHLEKTDSARWIPDKGDLRDYWIGISSAGDFLGTTPSYTAIRDPILRLCHRLIVCSIDRRSQVPEKVTVTDLFYLRGMDVGSVIVPYLLAKYLRLFAARRKSGAHISGGQFVARLAKHFGLLTAEKLRELTVIAPELSVIDMAELVRLQIYIEIDDTWAWVASGLKRQPDATVGAPEAPKDAPVAKEGGQAVSTPAQAPQHPPPPPLVAVRTMPHRLGRLEEEMQGLCKDVVGLRGLVDRSLTNQTRFSTWMISCMTQLMEASRQPYQAFDGTL